MNKVKVIAEIGQAHDGSLGIAHSFIDALINTGIDIIKFQTHIAEAESSEFEPFRINFSYEDRTRYEYWKRIEFSEDQWKGIKKHCEDAGFEFLSSPFSVAAVDLLERINIKKYKIGSGEVTNLLLLEKIAKTNKEVYISSGLSDITDIRKAVQVFEPNKNKVSIFQCTTQYPTEPFEWGLNVIKELSKEFNVPIGFSDHSGNIFAPLAAVTLGAQLIEIHVTFHKLMFGPDSKSSLTIKEVKKMVEGIRQIEQSLNNPVDKNQASSKKNLKNIFEKSLALNKSLKVGSIIKFEDLETKKPKNYGIDSIEFSNVIGKKLRISKNQGDFINYSDFEDEQ